MQANQTKKQSQWRQLSYVCLGAGVVFLLTAFVMNLGTSVLVRTELAQTGGVVGPIEIEDDYQVVEIKVRQRVGNNQWSFVTGELLDANENYLTGFGDEFYHETGYDSDGRWTATDFGYEARLTIQQAGTYFMRFKTETNATHRSDLSEIGVSIERKMASSVPHFAGGIILLVIGIILNLANGGVLTSLIQEGD